MGNSSQYAVNPVVVLLVNTTLPQLNDKRLSASFDDLPVLNAKSVSDARGLIDRVTPDLIISNIILPDAEFTMSAYLLIGLLKFNPVWNIADKKNSRRKLWPHGPTRTTQSNNHAFNRRQKCSLMRA
ncbi:MAG TPA: hypothetical protein VNI02_17120 [Blastocatellia bacterium]|jgi:hypothetical protein|nr:hypothetical protein [Blastocatellia bacterium]